MMDVERALIEQIVRMDADELAAALAKGSADDQRALRAYFGQPQYDELRALAEMYGKEEPLGNVVILPGVMGSHLETVEPTGDRDWIWVNPLRLVLGQVERLRLAADGDAPSDPDYPAEPFRIIQAYYAGLAFRLGRRWRVACFPFDWRKDLAVWAKKLDRFIGCRFGPNQPVHLVAHSQGGLLARTFIRDHPKRWKALWDAEGGGRRGGRLIMLGTPNHGSFAIVQMMTGLHGVIRLLDAADVAHDRPDLLGIALTFPAPYQHLPSPEPPYDPIYERLFAAHTWAGFPIDPHHLAAARKHIRTLDAVVDVDRMRYVAGANRSSPAGIKRQDGDVWGPLDVKDSYEYTLRGDGTVTHELGRLVDPGGRTVPMFYVNEVHADLPRNADVRDAVDTLLETGWCDLPPEPPAPEHGQHLAAFTSEADIVRAEVLASRLRSRLVDAHTALPVEAAGDGEWPLPTEFTEDERELGALIAAHTLAL